MMEKKMETAGITGVIISGLYRVRVYIGFI